MTGQSKIKNQPLSFAAIFIVAGATVGNAQEVDTAAKATLSLGSRIEADTNYYLDVSSSGVTYVGQESLEFNLSTETRAQKLEFSALGAVQGLVAPSGSTSYTFADPSISLAYTREAAASKLDIGGDFQIGEVISIFDADPSETLFLIVDQGTVATSAASLSLETRRNAPLGLTFGLGYSGRDYQDTTNPALFDTDRLTYSVGAAMKINDAMQGNLSVSQESFSADTGGGTETKTTDVAFSLTAASKSDLEFDTKVGMRSRETLSGALENRDGLYASIGARQGTKTGSIFGNLSYDASTPTERAALELGAMVEQKSGNISASIAANLDENGKQRFLGNLGYNIEYPVGSFALDLSQEIRASELDEELLSTTLGLSFQREINSVSGIKVDLDLGRSEEAGSGSATTQTRATLSAAYGRQLTQDWNLNMGYSYQFSEAEGQPERTSDSVYLSLTRNIEFGF
ncbi:MAG: hypothetical protein OEZ19_03390 [Paracoccaceae bacterium]|nr:hypothetical protein [Paracoccaceae bacterium]